MIGMLASVDNPKVKGFISLAGAGRPAYDIIEEQLSGQPAEVRHLVKSINDSLKAGKEVSYGIDGFIPSICSTLSYIVVSV